MTMNAGRDAADRDARDDDAGRRTPMPRREWLVTNGLGGYASGTVAGVVTRRYHGLLVAALPAPLGRMVMLNHLLERVRLPRRRASCGSATRTKSPAERRPTGPSTSIEFRLEAGLPVWRVRDRRARRSRSAC